MATLNAASRAPPAHHPMAPTAISRKGQGRSVTPVSMTPAKIISVSPPTTRPVAMRPSASTAAPAKNHRLIAPVHWNPQVKGSTAPSSPMRTGSRP